MTETNSMMKAKAVMLTVRAASDLLLNYELEHLAKADQTLKLQLEELSYALYVCLQVIQPILKTPGVLDKSGAEISFSALDIAPIFNITTEQALEVIEQL